MDWNRHSDTKDNLDDGFGCLDKIRMDKTCNVPGLAKDHVRLQISEPVDRQTEEGCYGFHGLKAIQKTKQDQSGENLSWCENPQTMVSVPGQQINPASIDIPHDDLRKFNWALGKDDGAVQSMALRPTYMIDYAEDMEAGCAYTFSWLRN